MGDGSLSQEEIDALLQGADDLDASLDIEEAAPAPSAAGPGAVPGTVQMDELRGLFSDIAQSMGVTLSTITGKSASLQIAQMDTQDASAYTLEEGGLVQISADYTGGASGKHSYIMTEETARQVAALMMAQEEGELTEMALSALVEGFSQMLGASLNVIQDKTGAAVTTEDPNAEMKAAGELDLPPGDFIRIRYDFQSNGDSSWLDEVIETGAAAALTGGGGEPDFMGGIEAAPMEPAQAAPAAEGLGALFGGGGGGGDMNVGVQSVQFSPLTQADQTGMTGNIGLLMDVSMQLTVELGRTKMLIKDILGMGEGTIVELDKLAGEPVDLLVNGKLIAKGEVVVIDENFGVRVTDIISPMERISNLE